MSQAAPNQRHKDMRQDLPALSQTQQGGKKCPEKDVYLKFHEAYCTSTVFRRKRWLHSFTVVNIYSNSNESCSLCGRFLLPRDNSTEELVYSLIKMWECPRMHSEHQSRCLIRFQFFAMVLEFRGRGYISTTRRRQVRELRWTQH